MIDYTGKLKGSAYAKYDFFMLKVNEQCDRQYTFELDAQTTVDSVDVGNFMRFANHGHEGPSEKKGLCVSKYGQIQNVTSRIIFDGSSSVAQFFTTREIAPHEELFFDYHYETEHDWLQTFNTKYMVN